MQVNAIFRRVGETEPWGEHFGWAIQREPLAPARDHRAIVLRSQLGYTGEQPRMQMLQNKEFVDAKVEIFLKRGSQVWAKLAEFPDCPTAADQVHATDANRPPRASNGASVRWMRRRSSFPTSSAAAFCSSPPSLPPTCRTPGCFLSTWLVGGALAFCGAMGYAELAALRPRAGGEYVYLREAYGRLAGFLTGWTSFVAGFAGAIAASAMLLRALSRIDSFPA